MFLLLKHFKKQRFHKDEQNEGTSEDRDNDKKKILISYQLYIKMIKVFSQQEKFASKFKCEVRGR